MGLSVSYNYGLAWEPPPPPIPDDVVRGPGSHIQACPRYPVRKLMGYDADGNLDETSRRNMLPLKFVQDLEQNQQIATCCRHPENHDIEAWYSCDESYRAGTPDIYILKCTSYHAPSPLYTTIEDEEYGGVYFCGMFSRPNNEAWHVRTMFGGTENRHTGKSEPRPFWEVR
jgi:hypothetical protein